MHWMLILVGLVMAVGCGDWSYNQPLPEDARCFNLSPKLSDTETEAFVAGVDVWGPDAPDLDITTGGESKCPNYVQVGLFSENDAGWSFMATDLSVDLAGDRTTTTIGIDPDERYRDFCGMVYGFAHELGHAFGLYEHSDDENSIMFERHRDGVDYCELEPSSEDLSRLRELY